MNAVQSTLFSAQAQVFLAGLTLVAVSVGAGWLAPPFFDAAVNVQAPVSPPVFVHPGAVLGEAARRFAEGDVDLPLGEEPDTSVEVVRPPPAADVAETFRGELTAIVFEGGEWVVVVLGADRAPRRLAEGALYRDGWRLASIGAGEVVLRRRAETRRIATMTYFASSSESGADAEQPRRRLVLSRQDARRSSR